MTDDNGSLGYGPGGGRMLSAKPLIERLREAARGSCIYEDADACIEAIAQLDILQRENAAWKETQEKLLVELAECRAPLCPALPLSAQDTGMPWRRTSILG